MERLRDRWTLLAALLVAAGLVTWSNTATGDYGVELRPAVDRLLGGDVHGFLAAAPLYGPSVLPRIPAVLAADALGAGWVGVYLVGAMTCMLGLVLLAWVLDGRLLALGRSREARFGALAALVLAPWLLHSGPLGHPEEVLAGSLCVVAVLAALDGRAGWAGAALGAAAAAKPWGLIAAGPVLLAAPGQRWRLLAMAAGVGLAAELPFLLVRGAAGSAATAAGARGAPHYFHPQQLFWPLHQTLHDARTGATGYRGPQIVQRLAHPAIVALALPLSLAFLHRLRAGRVRREDALALLALLLLARCLLDPWNTLYYAIPAVLALATWEALRRPRLPVGAVLLAVLAHVSFVVLPGHLGPDGLALAYLAWMLPAVTLVALAAFGGPRPRLRGAQASSRTAARTSPGAI